MTHALACARSGDVEDEADEVGNVKMARWRFKTKDFSHKTLYH